jgi:hypothetical protein
VKLSRLAGVLSAVVLLGMGQASFAADKSDGLQTAVDGALMVTRVGGIAAGTIVGTPVACVRETWKFYTQWTPELADKLGGKDCGPSCAIVSVASLPAAMIWGTVNGAYVGTKNGVTHGFNEPFTRESFSLGKELEEK